MGWLQLVGSLELEVSTVKEPYKRDYILQKRPVILRSLHMGKLYLEMLICYGVATGSRLLKIIGLFCKRAL